MNMKKNIVFGLILSLFVMNASAIKRLVTPLPQNRQGIRNYIIAALTMCENNLPPFGDSIRNAIARQTENAFYTGEIHSPGLVAKTASPEIIEYVGNSDLKLMLSNFLDEEVALMSIKPRTTSSPQIISYCVENPNPDLEMICNIVEDKKTVESDKDKDKATDGGASSHSCSSSSLSAQ